MKTRAATFYFVFITISIMVTCALTYPVTERTERKEAPALNIENNAIERLTKQDPDDDIIDNYPIQRSDDFLIHSNDLRKPRVIYRRISRQRIRNHIQHKYKPTFGPPKSRYPVLKPKYATPNSQVKKVKPKTTKKPYKKSKSNPKLRPPVHKRPRSTKPRRARPSFYKDKYEMPKRVPGIQQTYFTESFGEPPQEAVPKDLDFRQTSYGEPPVDSYGAPIISTLRDLPIKPTTGDDYLDSSSTYNTVSPIQPTRYHRWQDVLADSPDDNTIAFSQKRPIDPIKTVNNDDSMSYEDPFQSYSDFFNFDKKPPKNVKFMDYSQRNHKYLNKPWKLVDIVEDDVDQDQIIVGGQYAEPPARFVAKSAPGNVFDNDEVIPGFDSEIPASATISPYVNYKNSNMAFSPQNLNDAFGIIDK